MAGRVRVVIQARMGSSRLPGKILASVAGAPLLAHVVRRLLAAAQHDESSTVRRWEVTVATTTSPADDATERLCRELNVGCFRGPAEDVLARYVGAAADMGDDETLLRATADNPAYCPKRTAAIVAERERSQSDYACIEKLSYVVPEAMRVGALRRMAELACDGYCREHVTPYFRQSTGEFRVLQLPPSWQGLRPEIRLTVDTADELHRMNVIFEEAGGGESLFPLEQAYEIYSRLVAIRSRRSTPAAAGAVPSAWARAATRE